jgi:predicted Rossmann-fold nucleotide-binding protein
MPRPSAVCVYCASSQTMAEASKTAAAAVGAGLARRGIALVYGGGRVGLMGVAADAALAEGGRVVGIIPELLMKAEVGHTGVSDLLVTETMHERKQAMLDEFFEILTWRQLGIHAKPILLVDIDGFWRPLTKLLDHLIKEGAMRPSSRLLFATVDGAAAAMDWIDRL